MDEEQWEYVKRIDSIRHKVGEGGGKVLDFLKENYREAAFMNGTAIANRPRKISSSICTTALISHGGEFLTAVEVNSSSSSR